MSDWLPWLLIEIGARWPLVLLAALPFLLTAGVTTVFFVVHRAVASRRPEELAMTTEAWVERTLHKQGLTHVRVGPVPPGSPGVDAFWPSARYIALKPATLTRCDPTFWAIGAHEIGHALHARHPFWGPLFTMGRGLSLGLDRLLAAALLAGALVGGPWVATAIAIALVLALAANLVVLLDEGWASLTALRLLREGGDLSKSQVARAIASLIAALGAYVGGFLGKLAVLLAAPFVAATLLRPTPSLSQDLPWYVLVTLALLSAPLLTRGARILYRVVRPRRLSRLSELGPHMMAENASDLSGGFAATALVIAALLLPPSTARDLTLILALIPALVPFTGVLGSIVLLPVMVLLHGVDRLDRTVTRLSTGFVPEDFQGAPRAFGPPALTLEMHNDQGLVRRGLELLRVAYLPLLGVFWLAQLLGVIGQ
ncbi:MAG: hypothetical protein EA397_15035 [Deltaproteobacteria bacterium]|nr:MAG: hypothetical protein EA397_15035 [Deltaproteobacteria bacterium]